MNNFDKYKEEIKQDSKRPDNPKQVKANNPKSPSPNNSDYQEPSPLKNPDQFLTSFLRMTLFLDLFEHIACLLYSKGNIKTKNLKLKTAHPWLFRITIFLDYSSRIITLAALIYIAFNALLKLIK